MEKPCSMHKLPCHIDAPDFYAPRARYALDMLLGPLGIEPVWVGRDELPAGGLYYGPPDKSFRMNVVSITLPPETLAFFRSHSPYPVDRVHFVDIEQERAPVLFSGADGEYDLIASSFFWLSGWQEYVTRERDQHGRFTYDLSLQSSLNTAYLPVVEVYREMLARRLETAGIPIKRPEGWVFCPTHDIDYLRKWRPGMIYREIVEYFAFNRRRVSAGQRASRLGAFAADLLKPGDIFRTSIHRMINRVSQAGGRATYFLKTGAHGPHDVYYNPGNGFLRKTLHRLEALGFEVALHPSFHAQDHAGYLHEEKERLEAVWPLSIRSVRQHYLRYDLLNTSRLHEEAGFFIDSTLGFPDHEGFRRGTCHPFRIFDIQNNKPLNLWELPLSIMDGTVFNRRHLSIDEAIQASSRLAEACKSYGGVFVGLWHNTLWDELDFPGWGEHFERTMDLVEEKGGRILTLQEALKERAKSQ